MGPRWSLACLLVLSAALLGVPAGEAATPGMATAQPFERVAFEVVVHANGSARWTFHYERTLENATERRRFEAFAEEFETTRTDLYADFRNQSMALAAHGERATGRNMTATDFSRAAFVRRGLNDIGVVEMSFTWTAFAVTNGSHVIVADVFEGGLYLGPDQALVVGAGEGLRFAAVDPPGTLSGASLAGSDTVTWKGERTFTDNRPRIVLVRAEEAAGGTPAPVATTAVTATDTPTTPAQTVTMVRTTETPPEAASGPLLTMLGIAFVTIIVVGLGAAVLWRRGGASGAAGSGSNGGPGPPGAPAGTPELVDDYQRVDTLLREHNGRMRQSAIVEETGWSKSKVSMVLTEMEEEDRISKIRIGRENLISLPGNEPDAAGSPYEE